MKMGVIFLLLLQAGIDSRVATGYEAIRAVNLKADLTFLASEPLAGRMSLERGSEAAIQFIAAEFAKAGLKPAAGDSYLQPVPLIEYRAGASEMRLSLERGGQRRTFSNGFQGSFPNDATVRGPVVFAGYGITAPEFNYDDYAGLDARGKIVLVMDHEPQENDPHSVFNGLGNNGILLVLLPVGDIFLLGERPVLERNDEFSSVLFPRGLLDPGQEESLVPFDVVLLNIRSLKLEVHGDTARGEAVIVEVLGGLDVVLVVIGPVEVDFLAVIRNGVLLTF